LEFRNRINKIPQIQYFEWSKGSLTKVHYFIYGQES